MKHAWIAAGLFGLASLGWSQAPPSAPSSSQLNLQVLADTLRAASTFHDLVKNLNVQKNLNPEGAPPSTPLARTAVIVGAGAGTGAAIGEWSGGQKAVLIGAIAGAAGGLVVDQVMRHKAAKAETQAPSEPPVPEAKELKLRPVQ